MFMDIILVIVTLIILWYYFQRSKRIKKIPPGPPFCLPILGHLPFLGSVPSQTFVEWSKKYGPVLSVQMGSHPAVVINDYQLIRKAFGMSAFAGRPRMRFMDDLSRNRKGFAFSDGPKAMELRKFSQRILKDFGYGSNSMENRILDKIPNLLQIFEDNVSKPFYVKHSFNLSILNVLWSIIAGSSLDINDEKLQQLVVNISRAADMSTILQKLSIFVDFIPNWLPELSGYNEKLQVAKDIQAFIESFVEEHKATTISGQPRDYIDAFLDEMEKTSDSNSAFYPSHENITITIQDLFGAGLETTGTTLEWLLFYLVKYPEVQKKLQEQIDENLDPRNLPSSEDRPKLPYAEAVVEEVLRFSSILPISLFHSALEDTEFGGYIIPKGTVVLGNIYAVHHNKEVWGDPEIFRPERFLNDEGKFVKSENVLAFSSGKRSCIGEQLAKLQLFLYTVSIFQRYNLRVVGELPSEDGIFGVTVSTRPFEVNVSKR